MGASRGSVVVALEDFAFWLFARSAPRLPPGGTPGLNCAEGFVRGRDGRVVVGFGVGGAHEQRFVLAAGHVDALVDEGPEVFGEEVGATLRGAVPIGDGAGVEEQREHAADAGRAVLDAGAL